MWAQAPERACRRRTLKIKEMPPSNRDDRRARRASARVVAVAVERLRAACQTGAWLQAELQPPPAPSAADACGGHDDRSLAPAAGSRVDAQLLPPTLTCVDLSRCGLDAINPLRRLPRLELLNVSYNRLTSLDDLRHSTRLKVLYARSNRIADLGGLRGLSALQSLDLECNSLASVDALEPLWQLADLGELRLCVATSSRRRPFG